MVMKIYPAISDVTWSSVSVNRLNSFQLRMSKEPLNDVYDTLSVVVLL